MTPSKLHSQLPSIFNLFESRQKLFDIAIKNLQLKHVKEEIDFENTKAQIKEQYLLQPIMLGDPIINSHRTQNKQYGTSARGGDRIEEVITVEVEVPLTGHAELLGYIPNGFSFSSSDTSIFQPTGNSIKLEIDVLSLDKEKVLEKTNNALKTTRSLIRQSNPSIEKWSADQEKIIEELLTKKRIEIMKFYSN
ncbi:hypothetical protein [Flavihumibacter fluvii]|uniref:hypothetical protein n=1 Tax=Flavihumibacter fluvii TaxID=2838157 RepID=UPI001BDDF6A7|nr:hypothetical protein [Flavihumibacter fluvii]ULQ50966.1 hypothetical protein KJS93_12810 [Flavihumibacter fluvii]